MVEQHVFTLHHTLLRVAMVGTTSLSYTEGMGAAAFEVAMR
jgi:hypothetical protein